MSKGISTIYTKEKNKNCGRKGYGAYNREKIKDITPAEYGMFLQKRKGRK